MLKSETNGASVSFLTLNTCLPSLRFKALARSANSVFKMHPEYICFLLSLLATALGPATLITH